MGSRVLQCIPIRRENMGDRQSNDLNWGSDSEVRTHPLSLTTRLALESGTYPSAKVSTVSGTAAKGG